MVSTPAPVTLSVAVVVANAKIVMKSTLKAAGPGNWSLTKCRKVSPRYGQCHFTMNFTSRESGKKFKCQGTIYVRDIGKGPEKAYGTVYCNGKKVS